MRVAYFIFDVQVLFQTVLGATVALLGIYAGKFWDRANAQKSEERTLAIEILDRCERYCEIIQNRPRKGFTHFAFSGEQERQLNALRGEIAARWQGISDRTAREAVPDMQLLLWFLHNPRDGQWNDYYEPPFHVREGLEVVLGSVMRGERVPPLGAKFSAFLKRAKAHSDAEDDAIAQADAEAEYHAERQREMEGD